MGRKSDVLSEIKITAVEDYLKSKKSVAKYVMNYQLVRLAYYSQDKNRPYLLKNVIIRVIGINEGF
ncbi:hypothetical protein SAMN05446037_1007147 [Anaerovirgula multivorans]|uniref:Uncharacterized protein n=1 Tax=Anaerovirgula multivorans TaxID=312168 RepID=A0A239DFA5_9FIRM|nr:hypothetical protein [Anaerovirgula multivorans]SNS31019.1 hypothetical protein SAMN05446037_1007147 [Anaerovirgula multivorans]